MRLWWPRRRKPDVQPGPGPPTPLPGGARRDGDAWHDLLPGREALTEHTALLPIVTPAARLRGGGWR